jgi:hypothetical protein
MRLHPQRSLVVVVFLMSLSPTSLAQHKATPARPRSYLESWQGQPDKPDKIDHASVSEGTVIACIDVMPHQEGSTCNLKYKNGGEEILKLQQSTTAPKTDVVYLSCEATVPRRACKVQLTVPKEQTTK